MKLSWKRDDGKLSYNDVTIDVVCDVRNELNGRRALSEKVVYSELPNGDKGVPYMPRPFPLGVWNVVAVIPKENPYEAPEFISTDACQILDVWSVVDGHYGDKTGDNVEDYGYGLHNSTSATTLGCGRIVSSKDREDLSKAIKTALLAKEEVILEVV